jgi:hypothetical protein
VRGCKKIEDRNTRQETLGFARDEFNRNKNVTDIVCTVSLGVGTSNHKTTRLIEIDADSIPDINRENAMGDYGAVY